MKYTETFELPDEKDKIIFFKKFRTALFISFILGGSGFAYLLFEFLAYKGLRNSFFHVLIFGLPLVIFILAYLEFYAKIKDPKKIVKGLVIDKKQTSVSIKKTNVNKKSNQAYKENHYYYLFIKGRKITIYETVEVNKEIFLFFNKQDTMKIHYMQGKAYRYEKI